MTALQREQLRLLFRIVLVGAAIGAVYGLIVGGSLAPAGQRSRFADAAVGIVNGIAISASIGAIEIFVLRARLLRGFAALPFGVVFVLKVLAYGGIIAAVVAGEPGGHLAALAFGQPERSRPLPARATAITIGFSLAVTAVFVVVMQAAGLVGRRTFRDLVLGRYRTPRRERRFFLFVDVVGSTPIAERLDPLEVHRLLSAVFTALAEPVAECRGEIYQYVGDEMVVTWTEAEGALEARPLRCFFAMSDALTARAAQFRDRFGAEPALRAALHLGEVIAGEVGEQRRAIVFHGDVMNTASRLEHATRETGQRFIVSGDALAVLGRPQGLDYRDLGPLALRGRSEPVHAYGVEPRR